MPMFGNKGNKHTMSSICYVVYCVHYSILPQLPWHHIDLFPFISNAWLFSVWKTYKTTLPRVTCLITKCTKLWNSNSEPQLELLEFSCCRYIWVGQILKEQGSKDTTSNTDTGQCCDSATLLRNHERPQIRKRSNIRALCLWIPGSRENYKNVKDLTEVTFANIQYLLLL